MMFFRRVFNSTVFKFKLPYIDTCKTCDAFNITMRHTVNQTERDEIEASYIAHVLAAQEGYDRKKKTRLTLQLSTINGF